MCRYAQLEVARQVCFARPGVTLERLNLAHEVWRPCRPGRRIASEVLAFLPVGPRSRGIMHASKGKYTRGRRSAGGK